MGKGWRTGKQSKTEAGKALLTSQENSGTDYREYSFSWKERLQTLAEYTALSGVFAYLFYRSWIVFAAVWLFYPVYRKRKKRQKIQKRQDTLCREFKDSRLCRAF